MSGLDLLDSTFPHGTLQGFQQGCRGRWCAGADETGISCRDVDMRYRSDYRFAKRIDAGMTATQIIALEAAEVEAERAAAVAERAALRLAEQKAARDAKKVPKVAAPKVPRARREPAPRKAADEYVHGTMQGWKRGCRVEHECPAFKAGRESCLSANRRYYRERSEKRRRDQGIEPRKPATSRPVKMPRHKDGPQHGTIYGYQRGCRSVEVCPNHALGEPTCVEVNRTYHREYIARRKAQNGERLSHGGPIEHGTPTGYSVGCRDRDQCPGNADGLTCTDASLAMERDRRRRAGIPPAAVLVPSGPVVEHIKQLRAAGIRVTRIIERSGVPRTTLHALVYGRTGIRKGEIPAQVRADNAARIMAVTASPVS